MPINRIKTHLFLVDENLIPNITPVLDQRFRPSRVFLMSSSGTAKHTARLKRILENTGIETHEWGIDNPWDLEHVRERVFDFLTAHNLDDVALNVTCGTKPMSLAAFDVFQYAGKAVYHVHPNNDHVVWMHPRNMDSFDLEDRIRLPLYFAAHDLHITSWIKTGIPENMRDLTHILVQEARRFAGPLTILNALAASAEKNLESDGIQEPRFDKESFWELIGMFSRAGLFEVTPALRLRFPDEPARFSVNGGWLEAYAYAVLFNLRGEISSIQDMGRNIKFLWDEFGTPGIDVENEIDVAFIADNRLYIVECKTKKYEKDANEVLFKLSTLRDYIGGCQAKAMVISYQKLTEKTRQRAAELNIQVHELSDILRLKEILKSWVQK